MTASNRSLSFLAGFRCGTVFSDQMIELLVLWYVWDISQSSAIVGIAAFAGRSPYWLFAFWGASLADRLGPLRLLVWCNTAAATVTMLVGVKLLVLGGDVATYVLLAFVVNATRSVEAAAIASAVPLLTAGTGLQRANSLFDNAKRVGRILAPLATRAVDLVHPAVHFFGAAIAYFLMSLGAAHGRRVAPDSPSVGRSGTGHRAALEELWRLHPVRLVIAASAAYAFFHGLAYFVVLPRLSFESDDAGPFSFGVLVMAFSLGGIVANFAIARVEIRNAALAVAIGMGIAGACFAAFGAAPSGWIRIALAFAGGMSFPLQDVFVVGLIQMHSRSDFVARMHACWRLSCEFTLSAGILIGGVAVDLTGPVVMAFASGIAIAVVSLSYLTLTQLRRKR